MQVVLAEAETEKTPHQCKMESLDALVLTDCCIVQDG